MPHQVIHQTETELDAVNTMLSTIGEAPVNTLTGQLPNDVAVALATLREVVREIQMSGWHFNTEKDFPLSPDGNGEITLPPAIVRVSLTDPDGTDVVQRGRRLYDRANHTYRFTAPLAATVTLILSFEELPETFKWYATVRAARRFQDRAVGSGDLHAFTSQDEIEARAEARREDTETARPSLAKGDATTFISGWTVGMTMRR